MCNYSMVGKSLATSCDILPAFIFIVIVLLNLYIDKLRSTLHHTVTGESSNILRNICNILNV